METIDLNYELELEHDKKINNIIIADQKDIFDKADEIICKGKLYIDLILEDESCDHKEVDFSCSLNKKKYHLKDICLSLDDYSYNQNNNKCDLLIKYIIKGEDVNFEHLCLLNNDELESELRNYLSRNKHIENEVIENVDKIELLDPVIEEDDLKVEIKNTEMIIDNDDKQILKETYSSTFMFYRVKNNESIDDISKKFNISKEELLKNNEDKEFKENTLIQIKKNA